MSANKFQKGFVPITYILGMVILSLAIVGGVFLMKQTKNNTSNTYQLTPVPISATPASTPLQVTQKISSDGSCMKKGDTNSTSSSSSVLGITPREAAMNQPLHPAKVIVEKTNSILLIKWEGTGEDGREYLVCRRDIGNKEWQVLSSIKARENNRGEYQFEDKSITLYNSYVYGVRFLGLYGNYSQVTESEPVSLNEGVDQKSFINLTTCKAGEEINQAFGLGSRSLTAKVLKGDVCLMEYFQEIEGGGTISECNLPVSMGEITLPSLDVNKYCKEIRKTSLLNP